MSRNMTTAQSTARNAVDYRRNFSILHQAAIGVTVTRTREPFRAIDTLRDFAFAESTGFRVWSIISGWVAYDRTKPDIVPAGDTNLDPMAALKAITGAGGNDTFGAGVFVMFYPHKPLAQNIAMVQMIKQYARDFQETSKRLVLVLPPDWTPPLELEDDIVICDFESPTYAELRDSLDRTLGVVSAAKRPEFSPEQIDELLAVGAGMTAHEFENAVSRALVTLRAALPNVTVRQFADIIMGVKIEVVRRSDVLEVMQTTPISSIGGLDNLKAWITARAGCFSQEARDFGVDPIKGIALIGPPGTGKTASAKAIASVLGIPALKFDVGKVFASLVGESEKRVRGALKMAESMAPCVLMIDEVDKAFASQSGGGGGDSGVGSRVLGTLLTWMQETSAPVFTVVTANRVQNLPSEFLRKGRLDEIFSVGPPNAVERRAVLEIHLRQRNQDPDALTGLDEVVARCDGFVSAEIEGAVKDAVIEAFYRKMPLTGKMLETQFGQIVPLSVAFAEDFDRMRLWGEQNARPASFLPGETTEPPRARVRARPPQTGGGRAMTV